MALETALGRARLRGAAFRRAAPAKGKREADRYPYRLARASRVSLRGPTAQPEQVYTLPSRIVGIP